MIEGFLNCTMTHFPQLEVGHSLDGEAERPAVGTVYSCYFDEDAKAAKSIGNVGELEAADGYAVIEAAAPVKKNDRADIAYSNRELASFDFSGIVVGVTRICSQLANVTIVSLRKCSK